jgi:hypothetical protein
LGLTLKDDEIWKPDVRESTSKTEGGTKELRSGIQFKDKDTSALLIAHLGTIMGVFGVIGYKTIVVTDGAVFDSRISYK